MILFDDDKQRVEARKGLVTILDKATGQTRHATDDEAEAWVDHWTRCAPTSPLATPVEGQPGPAGGREDDGG